MTKIIVLNQNTSDFQYLGIDSLSRSTWSTISHPNVKVIHYYGTLDEKSNQIHNFPVVEKNGSVFHEAKYLQDSYLFCGTNDVLTDGKDPRGEKLMIALEYCYNNLEFDFIVRCCNTTYNDLQKMYRFLSKMPPEKIYDGARNMYDNKYYFVGGWHAYMSRDVVKILIDNKERYLSLKYAEDLSLGIVLMHELKYTSFGEPFTRTFDFAYRDYTFEKPYNHDDDICSYRFRHHTLDMFVKFHNHVLKNEK